MLATSKAVWQTHFSGRNQNKCTIVMPSPVLYYGSQTTVRRSHPMHGRPAIRILRSRNTIGEHLANMDHMIEASDDRQCGAGS